MAKGTSKRIDKDLTDSITEDPFAVDLFDSRAAVFPRKEKFVHAEDEEPGVSSWSDTLPQCDASEIRKPASESLRPFWLGHVIANTVGPRVSELVGLDAGNVKFEAHSYEVADYQKEVAGLSDQANSVFEFKIRNEVCAVAFNRQLISGVLDLALKGTGKKNAHASALTEIEKAVGTYLIADVLSHFNSTVDSSNRVEIIGFVARDLQSGASKRREAVVTTGEFFVGNLNGMLSLVLPFDAIFPLNEEFEGFVKRRSVFPSYDRFSEYLGGFQPHVLIGRAKITAEEIAHLEASDVVVCQTSTPEFWDYEMPTVRVPFDLAMGAVSGTGRSFEGQDGAIAIEISSMDAGIRSDDRRIVVGKKEDSGVEQMVENAFEDFGLEGALDDEKGTSDKEDKVDLESVVVDLKVKLAGRRLTLAELKELRSGQVLELGCKPDDPVELIADGSDRPIAIGELVKVGERLGVRVTRVFA